MTCGISVSVASFVALLGFATLISLAAERARVPAAVLLVGVGAVAGSLFHVKPPFQFGPAVLFVFLPPLVFEAAWHVDVAVLRRQWLRLVAMAGPGTILSALAVGSAVTLAGALPFGAAFLLGAIVSATDPVAVVAVFRHAAVPRAVKTLVEAESLSNDGIAIVLYGAAMTALGGGTIAWFPTVGHAAFSVGAGIAIGAACALPFWFVLGATRAPEFEVTVTVALAYIAYLAADRCGCSGIFATAAGAVTLRALLRDSRRVREGDAVDAFWIAVASIANATVFLATGLVIDIPRAFHEPLLVAAVLVASIFARVSIALVGARDRNARITIFLAGMRGALPLALALGLPQTLPGRAAIIDGVFATVLVTLVVQGAMLEPIVTRLYGRTAAV